jgi:hypothetical protein
MVNEKLKQSLEKKFFTRTTLAKKLGKSLSVIERMMFRQVIMPDAWVVDAAQEQPLFSVSRLEELKAAIEDYFSQVEAARAGFTA